MGSLSNGPTDQIGWATTHTLGTSCFHVFLAFNCRSGFVCHHFFVHRVGIVLSLVQFDLNMYIHIVDTFPTRTSIWQNLQVGWPSQGFGVFWSFGETHKNHRILFKYRAGNGSVMIWFLWQNTFDTDLFFLARILNSFWEPSIPPDLRGARFQTFCLRGTFADKWLNTNFHH